MGIRSVGNENQGDPNLVLAGHFKHLTGRERKKCTTKLPTDSFMEIGRQTIRQGVPQTVLIQSSSLGFSWDEPRRELVVVWVLARI
jgi:hypothetical protein